MNGDTEACGRRFAEKVELLPHICGAFLVEGDYILFLARFHSEIESFIYGKSVIYFVLRKRQHSLRGIAVTHHRDTVCLVDYEFVCRSRNVVCRDLVVEPTGDIVGDFEFGIVALDGEREFDEFRYKLRAALVEFGVLVRLYVEMNPREFILGRVLKRL